MNRKLLEGVAAAALIGWPAAAQEESEPIELEPITVIESATRTATPVYEATRSVTVVSEDAVETQKRIDRSVGDILSKTTPGFSQSTEANSDYAQTLRGRTFLVLIDGVPQSTPLRDGRRSLNSIDPDAIERMEVVRGGTAVYGFGATGGLVNIITKRPEDGALNVNASAGFGFSATHPEDSFDLTTSYGVNGRTGKYDYLANVSLVSRGGRFDADGDRIPADPVGAQGGFADSDAVNFLGKLGFQIDEQRRLDFTTQIYDFAQDSDWAGISFEGDPETDTKTPAVRGNFNPVDPATENLNLNLEYSHEDLWGSDVKAQVYYADLGVVYSKFPGFPQSRIDSEKVGSRLTIESPVSLGGTAFEVIWGVDYLHDKTVQTYTDAPNASPVLEQDAIAGFAQLEARIGDDLLFSGGVRHEEIRVDASDFTREDGTFVQGGRLNFGETLFNATATWFLTDHLDIYGGWSQGFTIAELGRSITDGTFATASEAESEAQKSDNYELGVRAYRGGWEGSLVAFYNTSDNGISFDADLNIVKQPERIWGVEAETSYAASEKVTVGGSLTWMEGEVDLDDDGNYEEDLDSTRIPPLKLTAFIDYTPYDWWHLRFQGLYSGNRDPDSTQFGGTRAIDDFAVFDLYSAMDIGRGTLELGIENIFNTDYTPVINQAYDQPYAYARAPGTTVSVTYSVAF